MSWQEIQSSLLHEAAAVLPGALPAGALIGWPNGPAIVPEAASGELLPWAAVSVDFRAAEALGIGRAARRYAGSLAILLAWPDGSGEGGLFEAADALAQALQNRKLPSGVRMLQPRLEPQPGIEGWHAHVLSVEWEVGAQVAPIPLSVSVGAGSWASGSSAIRQALASVVAQLSGLTVAYGNAPVDDQPATESRAFADVLTGAQIPNQEAEPYDSSRVGLLQVTIRSPLGVGTGEDLERMDKLTRALDLSDLGPAHVGVCRVVEQGSDGVSWLTTLQAPFVFDSQL